MPLLKTTGLTLPLTPDKHRAGKAKDRRLPVYAT